MNMATRMLARWRGDSTHAADRALLLELATRLDAAERRLDRSEGELGRVERAVHEPPPAALPDPGPRLDGAERRLDRIEDNLGRHDLRAHAAELRLDEIEHRTDEHGHRFTDLQDWITSVQGQLSPFMGRIQSGVAGFENDMAALRRRLASLEDARRERTSHEAGAAPASPGATHPAADGPTVVPGPGGRFLVYPHDLIGSTIAAGREWEPHLRAAIERHAAPTKRAVDVGAYIGLHTVHLARHFRAVVAIEPQRHIFHMLCGNLALNACRNVVVHNVALHDRPGRFRLAPGVPGAPPFPDKEAIDYGTIANAAAITLEPAGGEPAGDADAIRAVTLDSLGLHDVGFIKVDAQGADLRVLRGAEQTIRRFRPVIACEYERDLAAAHGDSHEALMAFLAALGYRVETLQVTTPGEQIDYLALPG